MKKVLITGASGFIGFHLVEKLLSKDVEVFAVCRPHSLTKERIERLKGVTIIECELSNIGSLPSLLQGHLFDVFYHLAWDGAIGSDRQNYSLQIQNITYCAIAAEVAKTINCHKLVIVGTVYEYLVDFVVQTNKFVTSSLYLIGKQSAFQMLTQLALKLDIDLTWCMIYHPIGKYMKPELLAAHTIKSLLQGKSPLLVPCLQLFDMVAVEDLASGLFLAGATSLKGKKYYIGSGRPRILKDYLYEIQKIVNPNVELKIGVLPDDNIRFKQGWLSIDDFSSETGYDPKVPFEEAVKRTTDYFKTI